MIRLRNRLTEVRGLLAAAILVAGLLISRAPELEPHALAQPPGSNPAKSIGLRFVPPDSAFFMHVEASRLWEGILGKTAREIEAKHLGEFHEKSRAMFGLTLDSLETITAFWPRISPREPPLHFGLAVSLKAPIDQKHIQAALSKGIPRDAKLTVHFPSDRLILLLFDLDKQYATPLPAGIKGPLTTAIQEATNGQHLLVLGSTLANLPDEIRNENLPPHVAPFKPIFHAESFMGTLDAGKEFTAELRVRAKSPASGIECEKALGTLAKSLQKGLTEIVQDLASGSEKDPAFQEFFTVATAIQNGFKTASITTKGVETRARVSIPANLPLARAYTGLVVKAREEAVRAQALNNLKQIALAMHNYHDANTSFPPGGIVNKTGKPLLSWRVLILPYVEQTALYNQFHLDEPWDSEHNKKLIPKMPRVYAIQGDTIARPGETRYRVFVGNGASFDYVRSTKIFDIADGTSNTILAATAAQAVPWTKPDELPFDPEKDMRRLLGTTPDKRYLIARFDGSVRAYKQLPDRKTLNAMITRAGSEIFIEP